MDEVKSAGAEAAPEESKLHSQAVDELYNFAVKNFVRLDSGQNAYISTLELGGALAGDEFTADEKKKIGVLKQHAEEIASLDPGFLYLESGGDISAQDLVRMEMLWNKRESNVGYAERIRDFGLANFGKLDYDNTGRIMGYEAVAASGNGCYAPEKNSIVKAMSPAEQYNFGLLFRNWKYIGHGESTPVWMCKPYNFLEGSISVSKQDLISYPGNVANRPQYSLINKLSKDLE